MSLVCVADKACDDYAVCTAWAEATRFASTRQFTHRYLAANSTVTARLGGGGSMNRTKAQARRRIALCGLGLAALLSAAGCQVTAGGQTLPSPYYIEDDVQYFAPGPEFKLSKEAAAMKAHAAEQQMLNR
jgi:hypothetical protein